MKIMYSIVLQTNFHEYLKYIIKLIPVLLDGPSGLTNLVLIRLILYARKAVYNTIR